MQSEIEELEELERSKDSFYEMKRMEMKEFKDNAERFVVQCRIEVENLRQRVNEVNGNHHLQKVVFLFMYGSKLCSGRPSSVIEKVII